MALYHFTLKSDRKPNKKKVKASEHTDYINREGKYANTDELAKKIWATLSPRQKSAMFFMARLLCFITAHTSIFPTQKTGWLFTVTLPLTLSPSH